MQLGLVLISLFAAVSSDNILAYFPMPFYSHHSFQKGIVNILLDLGHNVTVITEIPFEPHENLTEILLHSSEKVLANLNYVKMSQGIFGIAHQISHLADMNKMYINQFKNQKVQDLIQAGRKNHFDLMIIEHFFFHPIFVLAEIYDCPIVLTSTVDPVPYIHSMMGNSVNPISDPNTALLPFVGGEMTFGQRVISTIATIGFFGYSTSADVINFFYLKAYFPHIAASMDEIKNRAVLILANTNPALGYIRPSTNCIQVGFLLIEPPKPLIEDNLKRFLDASQHGVIYMNFGSIAKAQDLSEGTINIFLNVFKRFQYDVVWRFDNATIHNKPDNVFITNWVPQADLLAHPKVNLFISHAGIGSVTEAIDRAVPMIMFPMFGDQPFNSAQMQRRGVGIGLDLHSVTEEVLTEAIEECLKPEYKSNLEDLRDLVYDQPMTPREKAVWWLQHILKHKGADHLKYLGRNVPFYQKYCLDIILFAVLVGVLSVKFNKLERPTVHLRNLLKSIARKVKKCFRDSTLFCAILGDLIKKI